MGRIARVALVGRGLAGQAAVGLLSRQVLSAQRVSGIFAAEKLMKAEDPR